MSDSDLGKVTLAERKMLLMLEANALKYAQNRATNIAHEWQEDKIKLEEKKTRHLEKEKTIEEKWQQKMIQEQALKAEQERSNKLLQLQKNKDALEDRIKVRKEMIIKTNLEWARVKNQQSKEQQLILRQQEMYEKIRQERLQALNERYRLDHEDLKQHEQKIIQRAQERSSNTRILKNFSVVNVHKRSTVENSDGLQERSEATGTGIQEDANLSLELNQSHATKNRRLYDPSEINSKYLIDLMRQQRESSV